MSKSKFIRIAFAHGGTVPAAASKSGKEEAAAAHTPVEVEATYAGQLIDDRFAYDAADLEEPVAKTDKTAADAAVQAAAVLETAKSEAKGIVDTAKTEADKLVDAAKSEATRIVDAAKISATEAADAARTEAKSIVDTAKTEAAGIVEAAKAEAADLIDAAKKEIKALKAASDGQA